MIKREGKQDHYFFSTISKNETTTSKKIKYRKNIYIPRRKYVQNNKASSKYIFETYLQKIYSKKNTSRKTTNIQKTGS